MRWKMFALTESHASVGKDSTVHNLDHCLTRLVSIPQAVLIYLHLHSPAQRAADL